MGSGPQGRDAARICFQRASQSNMEVAVPERTVSDEVGSKLLFENDRVRVWDLRIDPGESTGLHRHTKDYLYVVIGGGSPQRAGRRAE